MSPNWSIGFPRKKGNKRKQKKGNGRKLLQLSFKKEQSWANDVPADRELRGKTSMKPWLEIS